MAKNEIKTLRINLQIVALHLESEEEAKSLKNISDPLFYKLENLVRDIRIAKGYK